MTIEYAIEADGSLLHVKAWGEDDDLEDVMRYGQALLAAAVEHNCYKVLCDERALIYKITTFDIYQSAKRMAELVPNLAQVAIVFNPKFSADAKFWETVAVNRGLKVSFFKDMDEAEAWLDV